MVEYFEKILLISRPDHLCCRPDPSSQFRLAIGSYAEQYSNVVSIIKKNPASEDLGSLYKVRFTTGRQSFCYSTTQLSLSLFYILSIKKSGRRI